MEQSDATIIYHALKNIIMNAFTENIDLAQLSDEIKPIGEEINYIGNSINALNVFAQDISQGNLTGPAPSRTNYLVGHLKELRSALSHLTWQAQQVTRGDYSQKVDFLGDFSLAFNTMIDQLQMREQQLQTEVTKNKQVAETMRESNEFLYAILDSISNWVLVTSEKDKKVLFVNRAAKEYVEKKYHQDIEKRNNIVPRILEAFEPAGQKRWEWQSNSRTYSFDSDKMQWAGQPAYVHLIIDITDELKKDKIMKEMAYHDTLTGLYNRWYGLDQLNRLIAENEPFCACYIDVDQLKYVNDTFGHNEGDVYLKFIADKLREFFRSNDIIFRMGGDEFVVLLQKASLRDVEMRVQTLSQSILDYSAKKEKEYPLSISYGIVEVDANQKNISVESILEQADSKMYQAKKKKQAERK